MTDAITIDGYTFHPVRLYLHQTGIQNQFKNYQNKTVLQTVGKSRYSKLRPTVERKYPVSLNEPLGEFLYSLKMNEDKFYLRFLNPYGDETYSKFSIKVHLHEIGLYVYARGSEIVYIGKTTDSIGKRINYGYGNISPKNCYLDGQATNCHLNSLITKCWNEVSFYFHSENNPSEINQLERRLINRFQPKWNIALKNK